MIKLEKSNGYGYIYLDSDGLSDLQKAIKDVKRQGNGVFVDSSEHKAVVIQIVYPDR